MDRLLELPAGLVLAVVAGLVFAEDALFVGFVVPGETAAVLAGVAARLGHVSLPWAVLAVVAAAVVGDSVGYEVGRRSGSTILAWHRLESRRARIDAAQDLLRRRGGTAVFLGRFVAFLRAVMPALAGVARMPYLRFLTFNAAGGVVWGTGAVLLGYLAGASYATVERTVGRDLAVAVLVVLVLGLVIWRVVRHRWPAEARGAG